MKALIDLLHREGCSCVIRNGEQVRTFWERGVKDLHRLYTSEPNFLRGAEVADKVIGRAAAALMIMGGVKRIYADTISQLAVELLSRSDIEVSYGVVVPHIINRSKSGLCPLESATKDICSLEQIVEIIDNFVRELSKQ